MHDLYESEARRLNNCLALRYGRPWLELTSGVQRACWRAVAASRPQCVERSGADSCKWEWQRRGQPHCNIMTPLNHHTGEGTGGDSMQSRAEGSSSGRKGQYHKTPHKRRQGPEDKEGVRRLGGAARTGHVESTGR